MKDKGLLVAFVLACLFASGWAFYLIGVHYDAEFGIGGACGPEGGCAAVLMSDDAEIAGVPVSTPAVALYGFLAVLGLMALGGKLERDRVATLGLLAGIGGLLFGGWLAFKMAFFIASFCKFCALMDAANVLVLVLALVLHSGGPKGAIKSLGGLAGAIRKPGPELLFVPVIAIGTLVVHAATFRHPPEEEKIDPIVEVTPAPQATPPEQPTPPMGPPPDGTKRLVLQADIVDVPVDASVPFRGPKNAAVDIILFEDFQCPYCKKLTGNLETLLEDPEIASKVRVGFMHYPMHQSCNANTLNKSLHKFACGAAAASICAGEQGKFWEMHDLMFRNNGRLRKGNLRGYARDVGLDLDAYNACVKAPATQEKILADTRIGAEAGVSGTPSLYIGGRRLVGAQPVESLRAAVRVALEGTSGRVLLDVEMEGDITGALEGAATTVTLQGPDGPFTIDAFEASLDGGKVVSRPGVPPLRSYTWYDAKAACESAGKRLCTEAEWLTACSGSLPIDEDNNGTYSRDLLQGRQYSYGEHYRAGWCVDDRKVNDMSVFLTGNHPRCSTPEGVYDMEGLTKEWIGLSPDAAALKGGSYKSGATARCGYYKDSEAPDVRDDTIGFRCCAGGDPETDATANRFPGGKVGDSVRDFSGATPDGKGTYGTDDLRGSPFIMTFWATWCEPCKKELPALAEAYTANKARGLKVIAINVDRDPDATRAFLKANPLPFPVILDSDKAIMNTFQSRGGGVPLTFWVQRDGTIRQRSTGYDESAHPRFMQSVRDLIDK